MAFRPSVDKEKCNGCEECLEICSAHVFEIHSGKAAAVRAEDCVGCESCIEVCKENAITLEDTRVELSPMCEELLKNIL